MSSPVGKCSLCSCSSLRGTLSENSSSLQKRRCLHSQPSKACWQMVLDEVSTQTHACSAREIRCRHTAGHVKTTCCQDGLQAGHPTKCTMHSAKSMTACSRLQQWGNDNTCVCSGRGLLPCCKGNLEALRRACLARGGSWPRLRTHSPDHGADLWRRLQQSKAQTDYE